MSLLVVGTVALDTIETPFGKKTDVLGGSAMHFSAAASFFSPVRLIGVVGEDFDRRNLDFLEKRGVDLSGLRVAKGRTFRWSGRYGYDLNTRETLKTELGVLADFVPEIPKEWKDSDHLFLGNIHPKLQAHVLDQAGRPGTVSLDTMNLWIENDRKGLEAVMSRVQMVILNEEEAREFTKKSSLVQAARWIMSLGPLTVVIKQGEYGALLFHEREIFSAPGLPLESVKDPTGAGDSFAGGMIGYLARQNLARQGRFDLETLKKSVIVGSALASFNVEDFGPDRLKGLQKDEIGRRVEAFRNLAHFGEIEV